MARAIKDENGIEVRDGCTVYFSYGIPPVSVSAKVVNRDGKLIALTPSHIPHECPVAVLKKHVGEFWVEG